MKNIKDIMEASSRYLFIDDEELTQAFMINAVNKNAFVIYDQEHKLQPKKRSGYFLAANGKGIIRFSADLSPLEESNMPHPLSLYKVSVNMDDLKVVNRREFIRRELKKPIPISFNYEGRFIHASLINMSEGGLRMAVGEPLPANVVFQFEVNLPERNNKSFRFTTDGLIVYSDPEEKPSRFMTGVSFIAPHFSTEEEKMSYLKKRKELTEYLKKDFN